MDAWGDYFVCYVGRFSLVFCTGHVQNQELASVCSVDGVSCLRYWATEANCGFLDTTMDANWMSVTVCTFGEDRQSVSTSSIRRFPLEGKKSKSILKKKKKAANSFTGFFVDLSVFPHSDDVTFNPRDLICSCCSWYPPPHSRFPGNQTPESLQPRLQREREP